MVLFCAHSKSPNTTKIGVSAGTGENPKWHFWLQKCHFGKGPRKGLYYLWYLVLCWKHYFYSVFSEAQLCWNKRVQLERNQKKIGGVCQHAKRCFFCLFFCCLVVLSFLVFFLFGKESPKRLFSCYFRVFFLFCVPKRPVLKSFFLPILFYFLVFLLSSLLKLHFVSLLLSINPFLETLLLLVSFICFSCLLLS